jgi:hypothetical protein
MTPPTATGAGVVQFLSIPAILAFVTGIGTFLKTLWDRYSESRSIAGINRLSEYLDTDGRRDEPLLTKESVELIAYELNLRIREISGSPPNSSIEKVERWRRSNVFVRAISVPRELRKLRTKESRNLNLSTKILATLTGASIAVLLISRWINIQNKAFEFSSHMNRIDRALSLEENLEEFSKIPGVTAEQLKALSDLSVHPDLSVLPEPSADSSSSTIYISAIIATSFVAVALYIRNALSMFDRLADEFCRDHRENVLAERFDDSIES